MAALAIAALAALALPHVVDLRRTSPMIAVCLWSVALGLRAVAALSLVLFLVLLVPATRAFDVVTGWCWHTVVPLLTTHIGLEGHLLGGAIATLPAVLLAVSASSVALGLIRAGRRVRRLVSRAAIGSGPEGAIIVGGDSVVMAVAGFARPQLVVSAGALIHLDDAELAAGLAHERGHIVHSHRWILVYAELCRGLARFMPGTNAAKRHLAFHLERDADAWAVRRHDPLALAGAICKAAVSCAAPAPAYALLAGTSDVTGRLDELLDRPAASSRVRTVALATFATFGATALLLTVVTVSSAVAGLSGVGVLALPHCFR